MVQTFDLWAVQAGLSRNRARSECYFATSSLAHTCSPAAAATADGRQLDHLKRIDTETGTLQRADGMARRVQQHQATGYFEGCFRLHFQQRFDIN